MKSININTKNWETNYKQLGGLMFKKSHKIVFKATDSIPEIKKMKSSCSCSKPSFNKESKELTVIYTPKNFPKSQRGKDHFKTSKSVTIIYEDGTSEQLKFSAIVKRQ